MTDASFVEGGSIFGGKIKIGKKLGEGAGGPVFKVQVPHNPNDLAMKVIKPDPNNTAQVAKASWEPSVIQRIGHHPHIIKVHDVGEEADTLWFTMDKGEESLYDVMKKEVIPIEGAIIVVRQIASALENGHAMGIIHRDLKPQNILLMEDWKKGIYVVLSDYGIALQKDVKQVTKADERSGDLSGTAAYMAPEAFKGVCGRRSDQYSLAVFTYQMLTGELPFKGSMLEIAKKHTYEEVPKLVDTIKRDLTAEQAFILSRLEPIVLKGMAKNIDDRYASVTEYAKELEQTLRISRIEFDLENKINQTQSNSERFELYVAYGEKLQTIKANSEALKYFNQALTIKDDITLLLLKSQLLREIKKPDEGLKTLEKMVTLPASNSSEFVTQAYALRVLQRDREALKACELAQMQEEIDPRVYRLKAHILENLGEYNEAAANYLHAVNEKPEDAKLLIEAGLAFEKIGLYDDALSFYIRSFKNDKNSNEALQHAKRLNTQLGREKSVALIDGMMRSFEYRKQKGEIGKSAEISERPTLVMPSV